MWYLVYLLSFLVSLLFSLLFVPFFRRVALSAGVIDQPAPRKVHRTPTPLLGGAGILTALAATAFLGYATAFLLYRWNPSGSLRLLSVYLPGLFRVWPQAVVIATGGVLIFLFGLIDDFIGLNAGWKLLGQIAIGSLLFFVGLRITLFIPNPIISYLLTIGWIVLLTNSFNLLDNIDGLAAGVAFIAAILFFLWTVASQAFFVGTLLSAFAGATLGFLRFNFPPASIFLGEAGSTFLGYFLAVISILVTFYYEGAATYLPVLAPIFILAIPLFDTASVIIIRRRQGRSIFTPGKDHLSHRLLKFGLSSRQVLAVLYLLTVGLGLPALILKNLSLWAGLLLLLQGMLFLAALSILEGRQNGNNGRV